MNEQINKQTTPCEEVSTKRNPCDNEEAEQRDASASRERRGLPASHEKLERGQEDAPCRWPGERSRADTLVLDFWPPEYITINSRCFKPPSF